jgi:hypothetical protein
MHHENETAFAAPFSEQRPGADTKRLGPGERTLAEVNWEGIAAEDLERALGARLGQLEERIYSFGAAARSGDGKGEGHQRATAFKCPAS